MAATVVLDNGAYTCKIGFSTQKEPRIAPNCVMKAKNVRTRIFVADQVDDCKDLSGLFYMLPFQKGYLVNWEIEKQVWDYLFGKEGLQVNFPQQNIIVTEPYFNFTSVQEAVNEILFEEYQFEGVLRCNGGQLAQHKIHKENRDALCSLVVDSGYSFTHIVPYYEGKKVMEGVKRINVGGKVLTNHLKEVISYRQLMVMDETHVINQMKEDVCYVSSNFVKDMETARLKGKLNTVARDYVLPDYTQVKRGYVRPVEETTGRAKGDEQIIRMNNERFAIPEILFHPSDVGIQEMGLSEAIVHSIESLDEEMRPHMYKNIWLTGGNCLLPGFAERIYQDVRSMAADEYDVQIHTPQNPLTFNWEAGCALAKDTAFKRMIVTRSQYEEHGHSICADRFSI